MKKTGSEKKEKKYSEVINSSYSFNETGISLSVHAGVCLDDF